MPHIVILARHGESDDNLSNVFSGQRNPDLTEKGVEDAVQTGQMLEAAGVVLNNTFTTPLQRASKTALLAAGQMRQAPNLHVRDPRLSERSYGPRLEGMKKEPFKQICKSLGIDYGAIKGFEGSARDGESLRSLITSGGRVKSFWDEMIVPHRAEPRVCIDAVFSHSNTMRAICMMLDQIPKDEEGACYEIKNGQMIVVEFDSAGQIIVFEKINKGDVARLSELAGAKRFPERAGWSCDAASDRFIQDGETPSMPALVQAL